MEQQATPGPRLLRVWQICGDKKRGVNPLVPISRSAWWIGVRTGRYPKGFLLSPGVRVWRSDEVLMLSAPPSAVR